MRDLATLALIGVLVTGWQSEARGDTITEYTSGGWSYTAIPGHSITTGPGPGWNNLEFNWLDASENELATGTLYLFSQAYTGLAGNISGAATGFVAASTGIVNGRYVFDSEVTIEGGTQYWIYADTFVSRFLGSGPSGGVYAGGNLYWGASTGSTFASLPVEDARFRLTGSPVPEPGSLALLGLGGLGFLWLRRRRKTA